MKTAFAFFRDCTGNSWHLRRYDRRYGTILLQKIGANVAKLRDSDIDVRDIPILHRALKELRDGYGF